MDRTILLFILLILTQCKMSSQLPYSNIEIEDAIKQSIIIPVSDAHKKTLQAPLIAKCIALENPVEPGQIIIETCSYYQEFKILEIISGKPDSSFTCHYEVNIKNEKPINKNEEYILILQDTKPDKRYNLLKVYKDNVENRQLINNKIAKISIPKNDNMELVSNNTNYSVIIDVFVKGTYKEYSYQLVNNKFKAIKYSLNNEPPKTIISRNLTAEEAKEFEQYINSFHLEKLESKYIDENVEGEHHLVYHIKIGKKQKSIYVYFKEQNDLIELYKRLNSFIPVNDRFYYY